MTKDEIVDLARNNLITVEFTKVNGDKRIMNCTLKPEYLPQQTDIEESTTKRNLNNVAVWDLDNSGWRSFRVDSVTQIGVKHD